MNDLRGLGQRTTRGEHIRVVITGYETIQPYNYSLSYKPSITLQSRTPAKRKWRYSLVFDSTLAH